MKKTCEFQLTIKNKKGRRAPVTVQIELNGNQVVGIRGLNANGADAYDISFKVTKRGIAKGGPGKMMATKGGDEACFECLKPNTPCPPHDLVQVPCS